MFRNTFGEPVPANFNELVEAIEEMNFTPSYCNAMIDYNEPDHGSDFTLYDGYSAEIRYSDYDDEDSEERSFTTAGYVSKYDLINDLRDAGITQIESYS